MLAYMLFKTQSMIVSATTKKGQPDKCLTPCSIPITWSHQQQPGRASQMLTYILFKTQSMLLSATPRKCQPDADLHPVENPEYTLVSNHQEARCWLTACWKPRACSYQQPPIRSSHMLTYSLFKHRACSCQQKSETTKQILTCILPKNQRMLLLAITRKG